MATKVTTEPRFDPFVDEHEALHHSLRDVRSVLEDRQYPTRVPEVLLEFGTHAQAHFVHEEAMDGFFDSIVDQAPRLKSRADALILEHAAMSSELNELTRLAQELTGTDVWWSQLNKDFESFWQTFCRHERAENDLVQEAFHDDIGSKD